jgi:excisionase family DNA binding protein
MEIKLILESDGEEVSCSLEEATKSFLDAAQRIVRKKLEVLVAQPALKEGPSAPSQSTRPLALSKAKAAQALGISVRTIDYCIANHGIRVTRIGRRVLVPLNSVEALLKQCIPEVRAPPVTCSGYGSYHDLGFSKSRSSGLR